ncbi:hypothetical protein BdWA1_000819 [Babesia duncani]|uniref:6-Cys domain-containing protein n=1 Tax=Babesia duncani TaxID=323732 RepID=A0AAD9UQA2_9APIC|nr:hypothetical protein BdWA1_000819 [Babesia duncani]
MKFLLVVLIVLPIIGYASLRNDKSEINGYVIKGFGDNSFNYMRYNFINIQKLIYKHYDVDVYQHEIIEIKCPAIDKNVPDLYPLTKNEYYTKGSYTNYSNVIDMKTSRQTVDLNNLRLTLSFKQLSNSGHWRIERNGKYVPMKIWRIYFDCLCNDDKGKLIITATIQLNILPDVDKLMGTLETVIFNEEELAPPNIDFHYYKAVRYGAKIGVKCHKGRTKYTMIEHSEITSIPKETNTTNPATKIEYTFALLPDDASISSHDNTAIIDLTSSLSLVNTSSVIFGNAVCDGSGYQGKFYFIDPRYFHNYAVGIHANSNFNMVITINQKREHNYIYRLLTDDPPHSIAIFHMPDILRISEELKWNVYDPSMKTTKITNSLVVFDVTKTTIYNGRSFLVRNKNTKVNFNTYIEIVTTSTMRYNDEVPVDGIGDSLISQINSIVFVDILMDKKRTLLPSTEHGTTIRIDDPKNSCKDCYYKTDRTITSYYFKIIKKTENITMEAKITEVQKTNPIYVLWDETKSHGFDGVLKPLFGIRIYWYHHKIAVKDEKATMWNNGKVDFNDISTSYFYNIEILPNSKIHFSCKDFFKNIFNDDSASLKLYPEGKNVMFKQIEDINMDPRIGKNVVNVDEAFGTKGLAIYKKPETPDKVDMTITLANDKIVLGEHIQPFYFICAYDVGSKDWEKNRKPVAVIGVDPIFNQEKIYGCGVKPELFYNKEGKRNREKTCEFELDDSKTIGFHCPSMVPDHFRKGDQTKWAPLREEATSRNPYETMVRCFDSSNGLTIDKLESHEVELFDRPDSSGEVQSLYIFTKELLWDAGDDITRVTCYCLDKSGSAKAIITVIDKSTKT